MIRRNQRGDRTRRNILAAITTLQARGTRPTLDKIAALAGIRSKGALVSHIRILRDEYGYVSFEDRKAGTLRLTERY